MSNPHAHPHTMRKTHAKFQNNWYKTVRGVALTRDTLCLYNQGEKWLSSQSRKSDKNWSNNYVQSICTSSYHEENTCKVSKQWVQNCKRSCAHKIPMLNVDGWTDEHTNEQKLARLCLPAKAGATIIYTIIILINAPALVKKHPLLFYINLSEILARPCSTIGRAPDS